MRNLALKGAQVRTQTINLLRALLVVCLVIFATGCGNGNKISPLVGENEELRQAKRELTSQIEKTKAENEELRNRNQTLSGLPDRIKVEDFYPIEQIKITGYTNLYDKDKDGKKEKLIVYIQPIDEQGDIFKAYGSVDIELWDLHNDQDKARLGRWHIRADELKKLWFATVITTNYRFTFDVADKVKNPKEPLNVKVIFTDHVAGKKIEEQKVIKPK